MKKYFLILNLFLTINLFAQHGEIGGLPSSGGTNPIVGADTSQATQGFGIKNSANRYGTQFWNDGTMTIGGSNNTSNGITINARTGTGAFFSSFGLAIVNGNTGGRDWRMASVSHLNGHATDGSFIFFDATWFANGAHNGTRMSIDANGNVGINEGASAIPSKLTVKGQIQLDSVGQGIKFQDGTVQTTAASSGSGTPPSAYTTTVTGCSAISVKVTTYAVINKTMTIWFSITGTSNDASFNFTIPDTYTIIASGQMQNNIQIENAGAYSTGAGLAVATNSTNTITCYKDLPTNGFTASGEKSVIGSITFAVQ